MSGKLEPLPDWPRRGSRWRHVKSGNTYRVHCVARVEATLAPVVVYDATGVEVWTRPLAEFLDGRFEFLSDI